MQRFNCVADEIRNQTDRIKGSLLEEAEGENPVIFGAGDCGHKIYALLQGYGVSVRCFCDNRQGGNTDETSGLRIISPEELRDTINNPVILVCVGEGNACQAIFQQLLSLGFDQAQIHLMNRYFYYLTREYFERNIENYKKAYQLLDDEFSKRVYLERMKKVFLLSNISEIVSPGTEEYFDEKVILTDNEMFIDCGGFDGDSARKFIAQCDGKYRGITIFEPELCKKQQ